MPLSRVGAPRLPTGRPSHAGRCLNAPELFTTVLRHDALFQFLSRARAHPVNHSSIFLGHISKVDPDIYRVVAGLKGIAATVHASNWSATLKHRLAFIIRTAEMKRGDNHEAPHAAAMDLRSQGVSLFIVSAPRNRGGIWRIRLAPDSPITGDTVLVALSSGGQPTTLATQPPLRQGRATVHDCGWQRTGGQRAARGHHHGIRPTVCGGIGRATGRRTASGAC